MHSARDVDAPRATWEPPILGQCGDLEKLLSLGVKRGWPKKGSDGGCPGRGSFWVPPFDGLPCILRFLFFFLFFFFWDISIYLKRGLYLSTTASMEPGD